MIQRIQTLFLLAVIVLVGILLFIPLATITYNDTTYILQADSFLNMSNNMAEIMLWPLFILLIIMVIIPFATIFLFTKRLLQIRLTVFSSILDLAFYGLFFYQLSSITKLMEGAVIDYYYPALIVPVICIILNIISIRKIMQDEILVKSYDRIR